MPNRTIIREEKMWLKYDSAFNILRIGLVSGSSATLPNVVPKGQRRQ